MSKIEHAVRNIVAKVQESRRLSALAKNPDVDPEVRLAAASAHLDKSGLAAFRELQEMSLEDLLLQQARIEMEITARLEDEPTN